MLLPYSSQTVPVGILPEYHLVSAYDIAGVHSWQRRTDFIDVCYACWFIRAGEARVVEGEQTYEVGPGYWVFLDPFRKRTQSFAEGTHLMSIRFKLRWASFNYLPPLRKPSIFPHEEQSHLLTQAEPLTRHSATDFSDPIAEYCNRQALFFRWLASWHAIRIPEVQHDLHRATDLRVQAAIGVLNQNLGLGVIDYGALQKVTNLSKAQIDRLFKQQLQMTPRQWCEQQCLFQAEEWLSATNYSIKEIAARMRFFDASHFAKWFSRNTGYSPYRFRSAMRA